MNSTYDDIDRYESYEEQFNPLRHDRQARRKRRPKTNYRPKKTAQQIIEESAQTVGLEGGFETSYQPSEHETI